MAIQTIVCVFGFYVYDPNRPQILYSVMVIQNSYACSMLCVFSILVEIPVLFFMAVIAHVAIVFQLLFFEKVEETSKQLDVLECVTLLTTYFIFLHFFSKN